MKVDFKPKDIAPGQSVNVLGMPFVITTTCIQITPDLRFTRFGLNLEIRRVLPIGRFWDWLGFRLLLKAEATGEAKQEAVP